MSAHSRIATAPGAAKEIHFFDRLPFGEPPQDLPAAYARYFPRPPGALSGEWTPCYLAEFWAPALLRQAAPDAKLLVILRDPVERFLSAISRDQRRAREGGLPLRPADFAIAADRSRYASQLERVFTHFPREQVLVLQYERCVASPAEELARTWAFLGLEPEPLPPELLEDRVNRAGEHPELAPEVLESLRGYLSADTAHLASLVPELDLSLWPSAQSN